ncbi:BQ5605_C012g06873 [Microbotryum silenes-dioicae]|uniref:BQ5605_C012g06873 protein n=1 Tax=Microbotryum silenes-dioicae TaxID=796604 RepID=A0A2X0LVX3_9BASI|nr:BQ5605_C012g06873 [Microbotryum silenes-dioicae]
MNTLLLDDGPSRTSPAAGMVASTSDSPLTSTMDRGSASIGKSRGAGKQVFIQQLRKRLPSTSAPHSPASASDDDDESDDEGRRSSGYGREGGQAGEGRKAKRARVSVSCKECKLIQSYLLPIKCVEQRRKIKCDRQMPICGPCDKRKQPEACTWDIFSGLTGAQDGILPPSIAKSSDLDRALARIEHIEHFLKRALPPNLAVFTPYSSRDRAARVALQQLEEGGPPRSGAGQVGNSSEPAPGGQEEAFWEVEQAALNLENGVFGATPKDGSSDCKAVASTSTTMPAAVAGTRPPLLSNPSAGGRPQRGPIPAGSHRPQSTATTSRFGASSIELTKALTTIVATERPSETLSRAHLNVEFDATSSDIDKARSEELHQLIRALPIERACTNYLVELYFGSVAWLFHHLHAPTFLIELDAFWRLCDEGREDEVDPCWLGLLLSVICVALDSTRASRSPLSLDPPKADQSSPLESFTPEEIEVLPERWFAASQRALRLAEWETIPRIRSIQAGQPSQMAVWLAASIRLAQAMGLHLLGSNPEIMPPDDPAFPPGKCSIKRETAKRLWAVLVYQDWLGATSKTRCYQILPLHFDTDDPLNLNDSDLSSIDWKVNPAPDSVLTDSSSDRVRVAMARQVRKSFDEIVLMRSYSYEKVLELDRGYKMILESLPDQWTLESSTNGNEQPMLRFQRHFVIEGIHNRIFRLHRPFSTRGYSEAKYRPSTDACLKSARIVIISTHNIADATRDIWYSYSHVMGAALVLFNDLFMSIDQDASDSEIDSKRKALLLALEIFTKGSGNICSPSLQVVVQQGAKIMNGLFRAEESRRTGRAAQALLAASGGDATLDGEQDDTPVESFADVLRRISRSLNTQSAPHRGTPPPTRNIPKKSGHLPGGLLPSSTTRYRALPGAPGGFPQSPGTPLSSAFPLDPNSTSPLPIVLGGTAGGAGPVGGNQYMGGGQPYHEPATPTVSAFETNPWPFPTGYGAAEDDLSAQFFQELDLSSAMGLDGSVGGGVGVDGDGFWAAPPSMGTDGGLPTFGSTSTAGMVPQGQRPWDSGMQFTINNMGDVGGGW